MRDVWRYGRQETGANNDAFTTQMCWVCVCVCKRCYFYASTLHYIQCRRESSPEGITLINCVWSPIVVEFFLPLSREWNPETRMRFTPWDNRRYDFTLMNNSALMNRILHKNIFKKKIMLYPVVSIRGKSIYTFIHSNHELTFEALNGLV